jgi:mannose-1-phosphate guanylyltransferase/phosphomannomutase
MILAAGVGSRMHPLTRNLPKPMVPIVNKPVMEHLVELLARHGFNEVMMNLHYLPDMIEEYFGTGERWGVKIHYSPEKELAGTAGGVKRVADFFKDEPFLVIGGDDLTDIDLSKLLNHHREHRSVATIGLSPVDDPSLYGIVLLDGDTRIKRFVEKPTGPEIIGNTANTGIYILEPEILDLIPTGIFYDFGRDLFPALLEMDKPFYGLPIEGYWCDVGNLKEYRRSSFDALLKKVKLDLPVKMVADGLWMGENVKISDRALIKRPVLIGNNCRIGQGAKVLENTILGDDCIIEKGAVVKESILWRGVEIQGDTVIEGCIVGVDCHVKSNAAIFDGVIVDPRWRNGDMG